MNNRERIVILPFTDLSLNKEHEHFSDGITEDLINALSKINNLDVISRTSSFYYKNHATSIHEIAKHLKATLVLEGSIRIHNKHIRISIRLIHPQDDLHIWSETWESPIEHIFETQDKIGLIIADKLREHIGHFEIEDQFINHQTNNLEAYEYYLKGKYHTQKWNPSDLKMAITHYKKSLALDNRNAMTYIGLSECYTILSGLGLHPIADSWAKINEYTQSAYALNPESPEVHFSFANIRYWTEMDLAGAYASALKAIEIKPNYARAHQFIALLFAVLHKKDKALEHIKIAYNLDPLSNEVTFSLGYIYYMFEEYDLSIQWLERTLINNPNNTLAHSIKCCCLLKQNRFTEVIQYFDHVPTDIAILEEDRCGILAMAHFSNNNLDAFKTYKDQLIAITKSDSPRRALGFLFLIHVIEHNFDAAFDLLEPKTGHMSSLLIMLYNDPLAFNLKKDSRYNALQQKRFNIELPIIKGSKKPLMDTETLKQSTSKLTNHITKEQSYLNPDITLRTLANSVQIHPNQLSWLINYQYKKNFKEFINSYRVEHFKSLVQASDKTSVYLIGLAYESGFNSRTAFNSFFKKHTGLTPSQYLKSLSQS